MKCQIRIETDALDYAIGRVLSKLTTKKGLAGQVIHKTNNQQNLINGPSKIRQSQPVAFFSRKTISTKIWYQCHNQELLIIVKFFKTWRHYLESYKYEFLIFIDHNNLCEFINTKNLSSCQV